MDRAAALARLLVRLPGRLPAGLLGKLPGRSLAVASLPMALAVSIVMTATPAHARSEPAVVALSPSLPDTLSAADAARFGLYGDIDGLRRLWFLAAPWGGYLVRLEVVGPDGELLRERNVPRARWRAYRQQVEAVLAGRALPAETVSGARDPAAGDSSPSVPATVASDRLPPVQTAAAGDTIWFDEDRIRVWPEVPVPPAVPGPPIQEQDPKYPAAGGRWVTMLEAGYQHNASTFSDFFTDMLTFGVYFGYTVSDHVMPYFSFDVGFGDITKDMEHIAGEGRSNTYNFALGLLTRAEIGRRTALYLSGAGGYFVRTLQWGGVYEDPITGRVEDGYVLEQQDVGVALRAGIQFQTAHSSRLRAWDVGVTVRYTPAERWAYARDGVQVFGDRSDTWVALTVRFWDTL